jgi:hypothetical protein
MSMPKGFKSSHGYATVTDNQGLGYREIAEHMSLKGDKMNHSTARNVYLSAMKKIAKEVCKAYDTDATDSNVTRIASDPRFQSGIIDILND